MDAVRSNLPRILYFVASSQPTKDEFEDARAIGLVGANVVFRNSNFVPNEGVLEKCDGVAGLVPERYETAFPDWEKCIAEFVPEAERIAKAEAAAKAKAEAEQAARSARKLAKGAQPPADGEKNEGGAGSAAQGGKPARVPAAGWTKNA